MAFDIAGPEATGSLPNVAVPSFSQGRLRDAQDRAAAVLAAVDQQTRAAVAAALSAAADYLMSVTTRIATPVTRQLGKASTVMGSLGDLVRNRLKAHATMATDTLESLPSPSVGRPVPAGRAQLLNPGMTTGGGAGPGVTGGGGQECCDSSWPAPQYDACLVAGGTDCGAGGGPSCSTDTQTALWTQAQQLFAAINVSTIVCAPGDYYCNYGWWIGDDCQLHGQPRARWGTGPKPPFYISDLNGPQKWVGPVVQGIATQLGTGLAFDPGDGPSECIACPGGPILCPDGTPPPCAKIINLCPDGTPIPPSGICPPPPPPPPGCCPPPVIPPCPTLQLPECQGVKICNLDDVCKALKDCLTQTKEDCAVDNEIAYVYKDCDGDFGGQLADYVGDDFQPVVLAQDWPSLMALSASTLPDATQYAADDGNPLGPVA